MVKYSGSSAQTAPAVNATAAIDDMMDFMAQFLFNGVFLINTTIGYAPNAMDQWITPMEEGSKNFDLCG